MGVGLLPFDWREIPLFVIAKACISDVDSVLDVGPGIRPQTLVTCRRHLCLEPHGEYADILAQNNYQVIRSMAPVALGVVPRVDTVVMLDVIEHMTREEGAESIRRACAIADRQVIVFTPIGFVPQSGDAWGMNGEYWQEHRSGWTPADFPGWLAFIDEAFDVDHGAFMAIWNK